MILILKTIGYLEGFQQHHLVLLEPRVFIRSPINTFDQDGLVLKQLGEELPHPQHVLLDIFSIILFGTNEGKYDRKGLRDYNLNFSCAKWLLFQYIFIIHAPGECRLMNCCALNFGLQYKSLQCTEPPLVQSHNAPSRWAPASVLIQEQNRDRGASPDLFLLFARYYIIIDHHIHHHRSSIIIDHHIHHHPSSIIIITSSSHLL